MKIDRKNNRISTIGFTLIEIMVVVVIIILIASVTVIAINAARDRTRDAIIVTSLEQIQGIAETVYNPKDNYKELYEMRTDGHPRIEEIRNKIDEIGHGRMLNLWFPEDSIMQETSGYNEYCSYVQLVRHPNKVFCVDSAGFKGEIEVDKNNQISCQAPDYAPYNCQYE